MTPREHRSDGRRGRLRAMESVAGWVFADLLLVLFIVGLGTAIPQKMDPPKPPPPTTKPTVKPKPQIIGMKTTASRVAISLNADAILASGAQAATARRDTCLALRRATARLTATKAEAALVLIFGGHPDQATRGQQVAAAVGQQLNCASPALFPNKSFSHANVPSPADVTNRREFTGVVRPFWNGQLAYGKAELEIYVFTTQVQGGAKK